MADYHDVFLFDPGECPNPRLDSSVRNNVLHASNSLRALHVQARQVTADQFLTPEGKAEKLATVRAKLGEDIGRAQSWLPKAVRDLEADEASLFSPPALDPGDAAGAIADERICKWFDKLDANVRKAFEAEAREGKHSDRVRALARSPVPGQGSALGRELFRVEVEKKNAARVRALEERRREVQWAEASLNAMARVVASDPWSIKPAESAIDRLTRGRAGKKVA